jgi:hypothetical protein
MGAVPFFVTWQMMCGAGSKTMNIRAAANQYRADAPTDDAGKKIIAV